MSNILIEEWEKSFKRKSLPTMTDFLQFLETKGYVLETLETHSPLVTSICKSNVSVGEVKEIVKNKLTYKHNNYNNKQTS